MPSTTTEIRDSIQIREVERRVEVPVPGDTVTFTEYIQCDPVTNKPVPLRDRAKQGRARVNVAVDDKGKLTVTGVCDSLRLTITARDKVIKQLRTEKRSETQIVYEHKPYWFDIAARWIAAIAIIIISGWLFIKLR